MRPLLAFAALWAIGCGTAATSAEVRSSEREVEPPPIEVEAPEVRGLVAAAAELSCALRAGAMYCWGGRGRDPRPFKVGGTSGAVDIAATGGRACVLRRDGTIGCLERAASEVHTVEGIVGARRLATGPRHSCATDEGGHVRCWGEEQFGKLGRQESHEGPPRFHASEVARLADVIQLALGAEHSCALSRDGEVSCWGLGADPRVQCSRDGTSLHCRGPGEDSAHIPRKVAGLTDVRDIAAHAGTTCALRRDGSVSCWDSIEHDARGEWALRRVAVVERSTRLVVGEGFGCALGEEEVRCWGSDARGQRGDGDGEPAREATPVVGLTDAVDLAAGDRHACAARGSGEVVCWGANESFQIGDGTGGFDGSPWLMAIPGAATLHGDAALFCVRYGDGTVQCLGENDNGQLGDGTTVTRWDFAPVVDLGRTTEIDLVGNHVCAVSRRGDLRCWGNNRRLFLGPSHSPEPPTLSTPVRATWLRGVAEVATTSRNGTCVRTRGGAVSCFGRLTGARRRPTQGPVRDVGRATSLDAGEDHFCASQADGHVRCWGRGFQGQLGVDFPAAAQVGDGSVAVSGIGDAREVAVGCSFSCALRANGRVSCWGDNFRSQLGGAADDARSSHEPVEIEGVADAVSLGAGCAHACVTTRGGDIRCWGGNTRGQLGTSELSADEDLVTLPVRGRMHVLSFATCVDEGGGALRCFGEVPGVPERADRSEPTRVEGLPPAE